jgi:hypothetical protein
MMGSTARSFFAGDFFLDGDQRLEVQDADAQPVAKFDLVGVRQQVVVTATPPDSAENVQRTEAGRQKLVTG